MMRYWVFGEDTLEDALNEWAALGGPETPVDVTPERAREIVRAFLASRAAWGAYPGNTPQDIQSGTGVVHNALLFDKPQKNVIQAPFRAFPRSARHGHHTMAVKPPWFVNNRTATATARRLTEFAADPKPHRLVGLFASALRG